MAVVLCIGMLACSGAPQLGDLKQKDGIWYASTPDKPFTGEAASYYASGAPEAKKSFAAGKVDGLWIEWYEDGRKRYEGTWKDGVPQGKSSRWYPSGQVKLEEEHVMGTLNGVQREYYEDGQKKSERPYVDGQPYGTWTFWNAEGRKEKVEIYQDGALVRTEANETLAAEEAP
jgi:antitoxin component YwqK of YwqJK toxin-antitoxin module